MFALRGIPLDSAAGQALANQIKLIERSIANRHRSGTGIGIGRYPYRQAEKLQDEKTTLERRLSEEIEKIKTMDVQMLSYFGPYARAVQGRIEEMEEGAKKLETRIEIAREDMRSAFADLKKIEITQERREQEERKALDKKETAALDEIGLETFRRREDEF